MKIEFKFEIDEKVITPLGQPGIIVTATVDNSRVNQYWINTASDSQCYREDQIKKA